MPSIYLSFLRLGEDYDLLISHALIYGKIRQDPMVCPGVVMMTSCILKSYEIMNHV